MQFFPSAHGNEGPTSESHDLHDMVIQPFSGMAPQVLPDLQPPGYNINVDATIGDLIRVQCIDIKVPKVSATSSTSENPKADLLVAFRHSQG